MRGRMQIELIQTFLDLMETRSFNRTAERLGITQSTVSGRVAALEQALGTRLFERSRAGTGVTAEGLRFEPHARLLLHGWTEARRAAAPTAQAARMLRIGIQNDLAADRIGDWVQAFQHALPGFGFYIEPDYSTQMCRDLESGMLDFAVMYTPHPHPDLHFTTLGEVAYVLIGSDVDTRQALTPGRYIRAAYSPAFEAAHRQVLPELGDTPLASGANAAVAGLLTTLGGAAFVLEETAERLIAGGGFRRVADVAPIGQPVYAAVHLRHRSETTYRRLTRNVARQFNAGAEVE